eukprot:TRINITY_DN44806_c0_g1_i1.p1 TRINITY_DN44806_c0_g1~~TRINITY_DN44806_c0_g1_i1.p1  ORF type:complete len:740 (-),score=105.39 TRINITY_DN44806_c0_g1_i1:7-2226(-)
MDASRHSIPPMLLGNSDARVAESAAELEAATARMLLDWQHSSQHSRSRPMQVAGDESEPEHEHGSALVHGPDVSLPRTAATAICEQPAFRSSPTSDFDLDLIERLQFHLDADRVDRHVSFDRLEKLLANTCSMLEASMEHSRMSIVSGGKDVPMSDGAVYASRDNETGSDALQGGKLQEEISLLRADILRGERGDLAAWRGVDARMRDMELHLEALPGKVRDALNEHHTADGTTHPQGGRAPAVVPQHAEPEAAPLHLPDIEISGVSWDLKEKQMHHPGFPDHHVDEWKSIQEWDRGLKPVMHFVCDSAKLGIRYRSSSSDTLGEASQDPFYDILTWWLTLEEPERSGRLFQVSVWLSAIAPLVIFMNSISIVYTTNWQVENPQAEPTTLMLIVDAFFTLFYVVELGIKIYVHGLYFFCNEEAKWNTSDFVLVVLSILDWMGTIFGRLGIDLIFLRMLRLLKLSRALKALRIIRSLEDLRLIMDCMLGSLFSLLWCIVFLGSLLMLFSLVFVQGVANHLKIEEDPAVQEHFREGFGSVQLTMLTLFAATSGGSDWLPYFQMMQIVSPMYAAFFLFYVVFFTVAAYNIVTGLFVDHALKFAQPDLDILVREKLRQDRSDAKELQQILRSLDADGSGMITHDEVQRVVKDERFLEKLNVLGFDIKDVDMFYRMLASVTHEDEVSIEAFVSGCMRLKGTACSLDLHSLCFQHQAAYLVQKRFNEHLLEKLGEIQDQLLATKR